MTRNRGAGAWVLRMVKLVGLAALFGAGLVLAGGLAASGAADATTTETLTTTLSETTTAPTTVVTTVEHTTTQSAVVPTHPTTTASSTSNSTPTWVWVVLTILACAVVGLLIALFARRNGSAPTDRRPPAGPPGTPGPP